MRDAADDDTDAVELAVELDRLLTRRDADGASVTETLEFVGAVSPEFLFGNAKETAPVNESIAAPGSFYACRARSANSANSAHRLLQGLSRFEHG